MPIRATVEIGLNRFARRGYDLDEVSLVPSRRTRDVDDVSTAWQIDAFRFEIPLMTSPSDAGGPDLAPAHPAARARGAGRRRRPPGHPGDDRLGRARDHPG